jgi:hypothetical protein
MVEKKTVKPHTVLSIRGCRIERSSWNIDVKSTNEPRQNCKGGCMTNEEYVTRRNEFIPEAEKFAKKAAGRMPKKKGLKLAWSDKWNLAFHSKMKELSANLV